MNILRCNNFQSFLYLMLAVPLALAFLLLQGCVSQQADLKQTERVLQQRLKQQDDQFSQARARQSQEISSLREQELPQLRGELDKVLHEIKELKDKVDSLTIRSSRNLFTVTDEQGTSVKNVESRIDSHDELLSSLLVQIAELTKQVRALEKR